LFKEADFGGPDAAFIDGLPEGGIVMVIRLWTIST